jgi:hypothetical protein
MNMTPADANTKNEQVGLVDDLHRVGDEVGDLQAEEHEHDQEHQREFPALHVAQVAVHQRGGHQHRHHDEEAVHRFHGAAAS